MKMSLVIEAYKERIIDMYKARYGDKLNLKVLEKKLDKIIDTRLQNPKATLVNNYINQCKRCNITEIADLVITGKVILGGDGCLFLQHSQRFNVLIDIIQNLMKQRKIAKKERGKYPKSSREYAYYNLKQLSIKIKINSLYGILGYKGFHLFNVNLAQSVTATGQNIISTAACGFENFMADNIKFVCAEEIENYLRNIKRLYHDDKEKYQCLWDTIPPVSIRDVVERLKDKISFTMTTSESLWIIAILKDMNDDMLKLVYYKNNLDLLNQTAAVKHLLKDLFDGIEQLTLGDFKAFLDPDGTDTIIKPGAKEKMLLLLDYYRALVVYPYPVYDRARRTKYQNKKAVLYIDTDSNFISLSKYVRYMYEEIYKRDVGDYNNFKFKVVSVFTIVLSDVVAYNFTKFTDSLNIDPEWGSKLAMKNEFYFTRIAFGLVKKRYIGFCLIQEGIFLSNVKTDYEGINNGIGIPEIKGYDFIKAGTKESIRSKYTEILFQILLPESINVRKIMRDVLDFKEHIRNEIRNGKSEYFKQGSISVVERYADPYRIQGIKGVLLWNVLCPSMQINLPDEVDIVPVKLYKGYTEKRLAVIKTFGPRPSEHENLNDFKACKMKFLVDFALQFPDAYELFYYGFIASNNERLAKMDVNVLSKPRALPSEDLPEWFAFIIDDEKIINDAVSLINPVMESTGLNVLQTTTQTAHFTNIVEI